jgi:hypothetical protein
LPGHQNGTVTTPVSPGTGDLLNRIPPHAERPVWGQVDLPEEMIPPLVIVVRVIHIEVVFPNIRLVVVIPIHPIHIIAWLHIVHQERLFVIGEVVGVPVGIRQAIVILILAREHSIDIEVPTVVGTSEDIP